MQTKQNSKIIFLIKNKVKVPKPNAGDDETKNAENYSGILKNKTLQSTNEAGLKIY